MCRSSKGVMHQHMPANSHFQYTALRDSIAKQYSGDADHGFDDPAENQTIHQGAQIKSAKAAQESGGLAAVTQLHKLHVREDFRAPPITREEKNSHHSRKTLRPPQPIARNSILGNKPGDQQWRVCRKRSGYHGRAGQPPGYVSPRNKELLGAPRRAPAVVQADQQVQRQIDCDDNPISCGERHVRDSPQCAAFRPWPYRWLPIAISTVDNRYLLDLAALSECEKCCRRI